MRHEPSQEYTELDFAYLFHKGQSLNPDMTVLSTCAQLSNSSLLVKSSQTRPGLNFAKRGKENFRP